MHVAIIGNGITGATAALELRELQPEWRISMISGESTYPFSRPALMYIYMGHMRYQDTKPWEDHTWKERRIDLVRDWVVGLEPDEQRLQLRRQGPLPYDRLLLATGSRPNRFGWPGQDLDGVQGLYSLMDLKRLYEVSERTRRAVIVGGGLIGIELAEMLHSRGIGVTLLVRESSYWNNVLPEQESAMVNRLIERAGIELLLGTELEAIEDDGGGRVAAVTTRDGRRLECQLVGLTAGVSPNLDLVRTTDIEVGRGVLVDRQLRSSAEGVLAAGDCAELRRPGEERGLLQQVWYTGKAQARTAARNLAGGSEEYEPGIWYNSAKFLDLEYQTYGQVGAGIEGEESLYWEHPDGRRSFRVVHTGGRVIGFNLMGMRYRHRVCEQWIREERDVDWVLDNLHEAEFDPEFFRRHGAEIAHQLRTARKQTSMEAGL